MDYGRMGWSDGLRGVKEGPEAFQTSEPRSLTHCCSFAIEIYGRRLERGRQLPFHFSSDGGFQSPSTRCNALSFMAR